MLITCLELKFKKYIVCFVVNSNFEFKKFFLNFYFREFLIEHFLKLKILFLISILGF